MTDMNVKECTLHIHGPGGVVEKRVPGGTNLYSFLRSSGFFVNAPCGGNGSCGKCLVRVSLSGSDHHANVGEAERRFLGDRLSEGYRLACHTEVLDRMEVHLPEAEAKMRIISLGRRRKQSLEPLVRKTVVILEDPSHDDQTADWERIREAWIKNHPPRAAGAGRQLSGELPLESLRALSRMLRSGDSRVTVVDVDGCFTAVEAGDTSGRNYCAAFDIGTTTVAAYLVDMKSGEVVKSSVSPNPQRVFGADVISRIGYTMNDPEKLGEMNRIIIDEINAMISRFGKSLNIPAREIYAVTFAGNTTMMHFLMGIPADGIAMAPFIPVTTEMSFFKAHDVGLNINQNGFAGILPGVSAYIGADTVAAVYSTGMHQKEEISLLVDIGTNGEIVLGNRDRMSACSAAAGPAFEGAGIHHGLSSVNGAIDKVILQPEVEISTIGNAEALGICGSGIVDAVAELRSAGILDGKGRFISDPCSVPSSLGERLTEISGRKAFILSRSNEPAGMSDIVVTQKDIREIQNAKAAIAAGIRILSRSAGIGLDEVDRVYLAGGFGSFLNISNAIKIGLLPEELEGRIETVGNAAGAGAVDGLLSRESLKEMGSIKKRIEYIELSYSKEFLKEYMGSMKL